MVENIEAIGARHHQIEHKRRVGIGVEALYRFLTVARLLHSITFSHEDLRFEQSNVLVVIDDEDCRRHWQMSMQEARTHPSFSKDASLQRGFCGCCKTGVDSRSPRLEVFRRKLFVVEHDSQIQRLLDIILSRAGFELDFACDGNNAWPKILQGEYAAIILDLMLPEMDGFHIVDRLAEEAPALLPRVIVATAADDNTVAKLDTSRIHALIRKPFDVRDLISVVTACAESFTNTTAGRSDRHSRGGLAFE